jgi:hypothetical protein
MNIRQLFIGGVGVLLLVALVGGAYTLGRSGSPSSPAETALQAVSGTPALLTAATARPSPTTTNPTSAAPTPTAVIQEQPTVSPVVPTGTPAAPATPTNTSPPSPTSTQAPVASNSSSGCSWSDTCDFQPVSSNGKDSSDLLLLYTGPSLLRVTGNSAGDHFAVWGRDAYGEHTDLFVNTTDPYVGIVPLNFDPFYEPTTRLEITAVGFWTVEVLPLTSARVASVPGIITGEGDDVLLISGIPSTAQIIGNENANHFAVVSYGDYIDLVVNTTEPYNRKINFPSDAILVEVNAEGRWTIRFY